MFNNIKECLLALKGLDGFIGACLADSETGLVLGQIGNSLNMEVAAAANSEVVRAKRKTLRILRLEDEIEDIFITLGTQYHLIRPLKSEPKFFFYLVLDRFQGTLALSRFALADVERKLSL